MQTLEIVRSITGKNGLTIDAGTVREFPEEVAVKLIEAGLGRLVKPDPGESVRWQSPLFGELEAPALEIGEDAFTMRHPLTGEVVTLPNEWLISLEERSSILEYQAHLSREEADRESRREFFGLFRKGGTA